MDMGYNLWGQQQLWRFTLGIDNQIGGLGWTPVVRQPAKQGFPIR